MLVALVSGKGSPGVTSAALVLAASAPPPALAVELDPSGGDVECWVGETGEAGLGAVVTMLRRDGDPEGLRAGAVQVAPGLAVVTAPVEEAAATASLLGGAERLGPALAALDGWVLADAGRWSPSQPTAPRVQAAAVVAVLCRPTVGGVAHAGAVVQALRGLARAVAVVVVGERPYPAQEVAAALGAPVAGVLPWDPAGVRDLLSHGASAKRWDRGPLARAGRAVTARLEDIALGVPAGA